MPERRKQIIKRTQIAITLIEVILTLKSIKYLKVKIRYKPFIDLNQKIFQNLSLMEEINF